jgi:hypothetical protein
MAKKNRGDHRAVNMSGGKIGIFSTGDNNTIIQINVENVEEIPEELLRYLSSPEIKKIDDKERPVKDLENDLYELNKVHPDHIPQDAIDQFVQRLLDKALRSRYFPEKDTVQDFLALATRVDDGNLAKTNQEIRIAVFRETAASFARKNNIPNAELWLNKAKKLKPDGDFRIDDGRFLVIEGKSDKALHLLRDCQDSEANGLILDAIANKNGFGAAYDFFKKEFNDPNMLSPMGLLSLATKAIGSDKLLIAEDILARSSSYQIEKCPAILSVRGLIRVELCLCRPVSERSAFHSILPLHPKAARFNDEPEKVELRKLALLDIENFVFKTRDLNITLYRQYLQEIAIWLSLSHPDESVRSDSRLQLEKEIKDTKKAVQFARFALDYGIPLDIDELNDHLAKQKMLGGWTFHEVISALVLALNAKAPENLLLLIRENRDYLKKYIKPEMLDELEIEALARYGLMEEAEALIQSKKSEYAAELFLTLRNIVKEIKGGDALTLRQDSFSKVGGDIERRLLIDELLRRQEFREAAHHLTELFYKCPTIQDSLTIAQCYIEAQEYFDLKRFFDHKIVRRLIPENVDLQIYAAWSSYFSGEIEDAHKRLKSLTGYGRNENLKRLMVTLAVETGKWEDLHLFLFEALANTENLSAEQLIAAAETGRIIHFPKTVELIDAAASKGLGNDDPSILSSSYMSVIQLGLEEKKIEANRWVERALELSGANGPVRIGKIQDFLELMKDSRERQESIHKLVMEGEGPLGFAAHQLKTTLTEIIAGNFYRNLKIHDERFKTGLPLLAGNRSFMARKAVKKVAIDRSSIIILALLGQLDLAFDWLDQIVIARGAMDSFLRELGKIRPHQPTQVESAKRAIIYFNNPKVKTLENHTLVEDSVFVKGISEDLQQLISDAKRNDGIVIVSPPIYKTGSSLEEIVDPTPFAHYICGIHELIDFLIEEGEIARDHILGDTAAAIAGKERWENCARPDRNKPVYLDDLSVDCLDRLELFPLVARIFPQIVIHESTKAQATALIEHTEYQGRVEHLVHRIRKTISKNFDKGKITLSPATNLEHKGNLGDDSLLSFLYDPGDVEAVAFDDRSVNKLSEFRAKDDFRVPIITTIDILLTLFAEDKLTGFAITESLRKLREGGVLFVPVNRKELFEVAIGSKIGGNDSYELRAIANYLDFVRVRNILKLPEEQIWLATLFHEIVRAIQTVWTEADSIDVAEDAGRRLLKLLPNPFDWSSPDGKPETHGSTQRYQVVSYAVLADAQSITDPERSRAYLQWVEDEVLEPATRKEPTLLTEMASVCREIIAKAADEMPNVLQKTL